MTKTTDTSERIEALAKAIDEARPNTGTAQSGPQLLCYAQAEAACRFFGFVRDGREICSSCDAGLPTACRCGEVYCPAPDWREKVEEALDESRRVLTILAQHSDLTHAGTLSRIGDALRGMRGEA